MEKDVDAVLSCCTGLPPPLIPRPLKPLPLPRPLTPLGPPTEMGVEILPGIDESGVWNASDGVREVALWAPPREREGGRCFLFPLPRLSEACFSPSLPAATPPLLAFPLKEFRSAFKFLNYIQ